MTRTSLRCLAAVLLLVTCPAAAQVIDQPSVPEAARETPFSGLNVLLVTAHPDDETLFAATVYRLVHDVGAHVDLALVTDGSGGFDFARLGELYYGVEIDTEPEARQNLPAIRKRELLGSGRILGVRNYTFLDEYDHGYTTNVDTVLQHVWHTDRVRDRLREIMTAVRYDYVLGLAPIPGTHGHHKGATILALDAAASFPLAERPVVLGADIADAEDLPPGGGPPYTFTGLAGYPETAVDPAAPVLRFDRTQPMEGDQITTYNFVVNWCLAEHKSQADLASYFNKGDYEYFWYFRQNDPARLARTEALFEALNTNPWR